MTGKGLYGDEAEGKTENVVSVTPINCDLTEVLFKSTNPSAKYPNTYGYFKTSEGLTGPAAERKEIYFKKYSGGVKSNNPCNEFPTFENFGTLTFS